MLSRNKTLILSGTAAICTAILIRKCTTVETTDVHKLASIAEPPDPMWQDMLEKQRAIKKQLDDTPDDKLAFTHILNDDFKTVIPEEFKTVFPPGFDMSQIPARPASIYIGSIVADDVMDKLQGFTDWAGVHVTGPSAADFAKCKADYYFMRNGTIESEETRTAALHIVGNGQRLEVVDVLMAPSEWPTSFDDEVKTCLINSLLHRGTASPTIADMIVDYPLCLLPPSTVTQ